MQITTLTETNGITLVPKALSTEVSNEILTTKSYYIKVFEKKPQFFKNKGSTWLFLVLLVVPPWAVLSLLIYAKHSYELITSTWEQTLNEAKR